MMLHGQSSGTSIAPVYQVTDMKWQVSKTNGGFGRHKAINGEEFYSVCCKQRETTL